jgi:O-antigen/teichoic acid export membrane protein
MRRDLALIALLFALPLVLFWPQTVGGKTLLPAENLYQWEPYASDRARVGVPERPHNHLLSDLVLQNMQWKALMRQEAARGELPLWNPHQLAGVPFLAAGQQQVVYPLSVLFYALPLELSYGWFTVVQLWLAGAFMYAFVRALAVSRFGAMVAAVTYQLCGMFIASAVFPMILGAAAWLPLILHMCEYVVRQRPLRGRAATPVWVSVGAVAVAMCVLSGHAELLIYTLLIAGYYSAVRLVAEGWRARRVPVRSALWLLAMVGLGVVLSAVQLVPLFEHVRTNWRAERSDLATVLSYAHPVRDLIQFALPNFYGSPAHHGYFDWFSRAWVEAPVNADGLRVIDWGIKNYVEAALYVGVLPLVLAVFALFTGRDRTRWTFAGLGVASLTFMFGAPTYALIYVLPGINQLNSPFRWIYGVTVAVCVLAALGADALYRQRSAARYLAWLTIGTGAMQWAGVVGGFLTFDLWSPLLGDILRGVEKWAGAFTDMRMFFSYVAPQVLWLGAMLMGSGMVLLLIDREDGRRARLVQAAAIALLAADLMAASWGFNAASDPAWLNHVPQSVQFLRQQANASTEPWRYTVINAPNRPELLQANMTMRYGLDDLRGYDSIISKQFVDYMRAIPSASQPQLDFNRIAPLYTWDDYNATLENPRFKRLNVRYVVTHAQTEVSAAGWRLAYEDAAIRIWEDDDPMPRALVLQNPNDLAASPDAPSAYDPAQTTRLNNREMRVVYASPRETWLIVSETYAAGWRAFVRPIDAPEADERPAEVVRAFENFIAVRVPEGSGVVRLIYSPQSVQVGAFVSVIGAAMTVLTFGVWGWRVLFPSAEGDGQRLARNTLAPILLNLFNRGIDFAFAAVLFRLLGPEGAGVYYYAIVVFGWFDIFTNFGLDVYLMREAARMRERAGGLFATTTGFRLVLVLAGVPLLMAFLFARQALGEPLDPTVFWALALFYVGLVPGSLSKGLTSLYYAFDRAEYPALVTTLTTLSKVTGGLLALLMGWGIVGLAAVSIITNLITLVILLWGARGMLGGWGKLRPEWSGVGGMARGSWPLMLNHFLATIFFQIDIVLLEAMKGERVVGLYRVAYSWLLAINVVPAFFTQALMATLSRQADSDKAAFLRTYRLGIKFLVMLALPFAVMFSVLAEPLTLLLAGTAYLPDGAIALQLMVWSIPIGWMNSLTQYALVALNLQRRVTWAFALACAFNITANLIFIPQFSYQAAAITTILSELMLFVPFALLIERGTGQRVAWWRILWKPYAAAAVMLGWALGTAGLMGVWLAVGSAMGVYGLVLWRLRPLDADEAALIAPALPAPVRRALGQSRS